MKNEQRLGQYSLLQPLGSGGFANVYLGEHIYLRTKAAIKVLHADADLSRKEIASFLREARTIARLSHPHIISILDFDIENGIPYLVMEYAPNGSLYTHHPDRSVLKPELALSYVQQIASALQFAHDHQVIHCDIKPANMLLNAKNEILLSDFGIAIVLSSNLKTQGAVGTMYYMAPEQFIGKPEPASDQYGLAVVAYNWLCGQLPFRGRDTTEMYRLHALERPRSLREIKPAIPRALDQVILTALAKKPEKRFASIAAFAEAMEQAISAKPVPAPIANRAALSQPQIRTRTPVYNAEAQPLLPSLSSLLPTVSSDEQQPAASSIDDSPQQVVSPFDATIPALYDDNATVLSPHATVQATGDIPTVAAPPPAALTPRYRDPDIEDMPTILAPELYPTVAAPPPLASPAAQAPSLPEPRSLGLAVPLTQESLLSYDKHHDWVATVSWSSDGKVIASGSWDKTVQVWNATTGATLLTYRGHTQPVKSICWSPRGSAIASGSQDNSIHIWNAVTGDILQTYDYEVPVESVSWSPDGRALAAAGADGTVSVWRTSDQQSLLSYIGHQGPMWCVSWSPDSRYLAAASDNHTVLVWDVSSGNHVLTYTRHQDPVTVVAWSPDGRHIASGDEKGRVHLWSANSGNLLLRYQDDAGTVKALGWSHNSKFLASAVKSVQVWQITDPLPEKAAFTYNDHTNWVNALAWSPNGPIIASASDDQTVQVWQAE